MKKFSVFNWNKLENQNILSTYYITFASVNISLVSSKFLPISSHKVTRNSQLTESVTSETWFYIFFWTPIGSPQIENVQFSETLICQKIVWKEYPVYHIAVLAISWGFILNNIHP